jgi:hypothetical protein
VRIDGWQYFKRGHFSRAFAYVHGQGRAMSATTHPDLTHGRNPLAEIGGVIRAPSRSREASTATLAESDDAVRHLKASESVEAAFHAMGFPSLPGLTALITDHVKGATQSIPLKDIRNMTPGTGQLGTSAMSGVSLIVSMMNPAQREAAKAGVNPFDAAAVLKFSDALNKVGFGAAVAALGKGEGGSSGRVTSDAYTRELSGGAAYKSLIGEGYSRGQLDAVMPYAHMLGWTDKDSLRTLAGAGREAAAIAAHYKDARAKGDDEGATQDVQKLEQMANDPKTPKSQRKHINDLLQKLRKDAANDIKNGVQETTPTSRATTITEQNVISQGEQKTDQTILGGLLKTAQLGDDAPVKTSAAEKPEPKEPERVEAKNNTGAKSAPGPAPT